MREAPNIPPPVAQPSPDAGAPRRGGRITDRIMSDEMRRRVRPQPFLKRVLEPYLERLTNPASALMRNVNIDEVRIRLLRAGFPMGLRAQSFVLLKYFSGFILGPLLFLAYFPILGMVAQAYGYTLSPALIPFFMAIGGLYGFRMPDVWLGIKMIDLISVSVEAGLGLVSAIQRVSTRFPNALAEEFLRTLQEVRLGRPQTDALRDMARRVDLPDLTTLLTSIVQAELLGLAIANVLRVQSERLRERRAQRAREAAQKAPIKMTFPLVLFIFPALFVVILGPAFIKIFMQPSF